MQFVLEIGTEEMPARFVTRLAGDIKSIFDNLLSEARIGYGEVESKATPRRIVARVLDLDEAQKREEEVVTGPPVQAAFDADGNPTKAAQGFARSHGVDPADLFTQAKGKKEFVAAKKIVGGKTAGEILPEMCVQAVNSLNFPKKMHWGALDYGFGRPIRWFMALLDNEVVPFELAGLASGRESIGHRVMGRGPWNVENASDYEGVITEQGKITLDPKDRMEMITSRGDELATELGGSVVWKDSLLDEVANLVEFPNPILGRFSDKYLELPREVLLTSMQSHQKSFGLENGDGGLMPYFLTTLNLEPDDVALVRKGWERVLKARLEDAVFFWEADLKVDLGTWVDKLDNVTFLAALGSMGHKARRLEKLCLWLAEKLEMENPSDMARAGKLAKADLVSEMVNEFDSLQGIMGSIYAGRKGESQTVCQALGEQYLPAGPATPVPSTLAGAILSMADKADTLAGCFGLGMVPKGANDPYALRRAVLGISRILIEHGLRLDLGEFLARAQAGYEGVEWKVAPEKALEGMLDFAGQRLKALFTGQGTATRIVDTALGAGFGDVWALSSRIKALAEFSQAEDFEQSVLTFKRAANIIRKQGDQAAAPLTGEVLDKHFEAEQEKALAAKIGETLPRFDELWSSDDFAGILGLLGELRPHVDDFFDNVMVMAENEDVRLNRLNLLKSLVDMLARMADFNALQV